MHQEHFNLDPKDMTSLEEELAAAGVPMATEAPARDVAAVVRTIDMALAGKTRLRPRVEGDEVVFEAVPGGEIERVRLADLSGDHPLSADELGERLGRALDERRS